MKRILLAVIPRFIAFTVVFLVCGIGISISYATPVTYEHNVTPQVMLSPENGVRSPINISTLFSLRCVNNGSQDEANVPIVISISNNSGAPPFRDTLRIKGWKHGQTIDTFFREFAPGHIGTYKVTIITLLESDENALITSKLSLTIKEAFRSWGEVPLLVVQVLEFISVNKFPVVILSFAG